MDSKIYLVNIYAYFNTEVLIKKLIQFLFRINKN